MFTLLRRGFKFFEKGVHLYENNIIFMLFGGVHVFEKGVKFFGKGAFMFINNTK